jgi:hypothetical protein
VRAGRDLHQDNDGREVSFGDDFGDVAVKVNGVRVEVHTDGRSVDV